MPLQSEPPRLPLPRGLALGAFALTVATAFSAVPPHLRTLLWVAAIGCTGTIWRTGARARVPGQGFAWPVLALVAIAATAARLYRIDAIPRGAYLDEMAALRNSLLVMERPFDLFGMTPLAHEGWVMTSNLYLNFDAVIVRIFGATYLGVKLFSIIPGIAACIFFYLACTRIFTTRIAGTVGLLFAFAHWHIRLSRYGWDVSFLVMTVAAALWLTLRGEQEDDPLATFAAGVATAIGLYSYVGGRLCLLAFGGYLAIQALRSRTARVHLIAFGSGVVATAMPLLVYLAGHAETTWVRTAELSIFNRPDTAMLLVGNIWRHLLMFNVRGSLYSRDNIPGLPMLDVATGVLLLVGCAWLVWQWRRPLALLILSLVVGTLAGGILSVSQEGAPYSYRTATAAVPAILIAGLGLAWLVEMLMRWRPALSRAAAEWGLATALLVVAIPLNLYDYFVLEPKSISAIRVMGYKYRLISQQRPIVGSLIYLTAGVFAKLDNDPTPEDPYGMYNGEARYESFGWPFLSISLACLSGNCSLERTVLENMQTSPFGLMDDSQLERPLELPLTVLISVNDEARVRALQARYQAQGVEDQVLRAPTGAPLFHLVGIGTNMR